MKFPTIKEMAEEVAEKALDEFEYKGKTLRQWIDAIYAASESFEWCTDCKEYDQEQHCCHRYSKVIRQAFEEMKENHHDKETYSFKPKLYRTNELFIPRRFLYAH